MPRPELCENCEYFNEVNGNLFCNRYPPVPLVLDHQWNGMVNGIDVYGPAIINKLPEVTRDFGCGEFLKS